MSDKHQVNQDMRVLVPRILLDRHILPRWWQGGPSQRESTVDRILRERETKIEYFPPDLNGGVNVRKREKSR
jgi:hypothetical protein